MKALDCLKLIDYISLIAGQKLFPYFLMDWTIISLNLPNTPFSSFQSQKALSGALSAGALMSQELAGEEKLLLPSLLGCSRSIRLLLNISATTAGINFSIPF